MSTHNIPASQSFTPAPLPFQSPFRFRQPAAGQVFDQSKSFIRSKAVVFSVSAPAPLIPSYAKATANPMSTHNIPVMMIRRVFMSCPHSPQYPAVS